MSETWTPANSTAETWTGTAASLRVFSPTVFSLAYHTGLRVFALSNPTGTVDIWDAVTAQSETWMAA